jgi:iron(III) transport system ATP-binding protein
MLHLAVPANGADTIPPPAGAPDGVQLHARIPGRYLPEENDLLDVQLDRSQTFVFPADHVT